MITAVDLWFPILYAGFRSRHPNSPETTDILKALLAELVHHLYRYFEDDDGSVIQTGPMSFHIPLHRMFARIFSVYLGTATAQKVRRERPYVA